MLSLRQKASRFFRVKSSSSSGSDSGSVKTEAGIIEGKNKRAKSMPLDISPYAGDIGQTGDVQGLTVSSSLPVISMPIPELVDAKGSPATALEGLGVLESKADEVIQVDNERSAKNAKLNDKVAIFKSFNDTLQFKSTAQDIMSQAKNGLCDDPWFMRALDDVAKIHPFVSVAVIAFKACYNMEMARRQNDKRVIALFREMKEMIEVLVRLKDITDPQVLGLNGNMIRGKLQTLVDAAAQDIKDCGNACDVWMKKTVLVKVLVGPAWEGRLAAFTSGFAARRMEFEFALQIHTASGVDAIRAVTTAMNDRLAQMSQQFALAFSQMRSPEELRLAEVVRLKGGVDAVKNNDAVLRELFKAEKPPTHSKGTPVASAAGKAKALQGGDGTKDQRVSDKSVQRSEYTFSDFKVELREDWDTALQSNLEAFEGKFRLFYDQLETSLHRYMQEESNRVIEEVTKGPHNLIQEPELRVIWQEMHWRRNVKARKFVVTLRDHFADSVQVSSAQDKPENSSTLELATDNWARQYVDVKYLQPIIDAIDDDGSGHITITEVNRFTNELPKSLGWSLMLWLAYWAIGWQTFAAKYRNEILQIFARMFAMRDRILPENRGSVDYYLRMTWPISSQLTKSLSSPLTSIPESHEEKFKEYVQFEEDRLRNNLVRIKYDIDAVETVYGVMGPGRIEKVNLLALLALILRRDLELFDLATRSRLHIEELWDAADSILLVSYAVYSRYQDLVVQFQQQRLDVGQAMKTIACELFDYYHDSSSLDKMSYALAAKEQEPTDEQLPSAQLGDMQPNNYPIPTEWPYDCEGYNAASELLTEADLAAPDGVKLFLGEWNGFIHDQNGMNDKSMVSFFGHAAIEKDYQVEGSSWAGNLPFTITASVIETDGIYKIKAVISYARELSDRYFYGTLQPDGSITGSQGDSVDETTHSALFIWMRTPADLMRLRPVPPYWVTSESPSEPKVPSKARAMFDYAIRATIFLNRKSSWSWSYFKERRDIRLKFMEFLTAYGIDNTAYDSKPEVMDGILRSVTNVDRRFYDSYWDYEWSLMMHDTAYCDVCSTTCHGSRYTCLNCLYNVTAESNYWSTVDFCSLKCSQTTVHPVTVNTPHRSDHNIVHVRTLRHDRDNAHDFGEARAAADYLLSTLPVAVKPDTTDERHEGDDDAIDCAGGPQAGILDESPFVPAGPHCGICKETITLPCWICVHCYINDTSNPLYLCDTCEGQALLKCFTCSKPYKQSPRVYNLNGRHNFQCVTCIATRVAAAPVVDAPHTLLHPLVRCCAKEVQIKELTTEERVVAVDRKIDELEQRILKLESHIERIEQLMVKGNVVPASSTQ